MRERTLRMLVFNGVNWVVSLKKQTKEFTDFTHTLELGQELCNPFQCNILKESVASGFCYTYP